MDLPRRIELAGCVVDLGARLARWPDGDRSLTPTETGLLSHLMAAEGRVVSQRDLLREVWGYRGGVVSRTVKTTVGRLRAKIERDASNPDHLLTVVGAGYRFEGGDPRDDEATVDEPAPREGGVTRVFLPQRPIGVVGRDALVSTASEAVSANRLVSLVGTAGVGKSTVALATAHEIAHSDRFAEVRWCALDGTRGRSALLRTIADTLGVELRSDDGEAAPAALAEAMRGRGSTLLVLDGVEGSLEATGEIATTLRDGCPELSLLLTSRELPRLRGGHALPIAPLDAADSAALFIERGTITGSLPGYDDADALGLVLARLDGLPLAIELAAGWASFLAPADLASRLEHQLDLLDSGRGGLRAAIASSWELLAEGERSALIQLAAFAGPAPIDAIEAVVVLPDRSPPLATIRRLSDRSLSRQLPPPGGPHTGSPWVGLFEAVRQFSVEQGGDASAEARHGAWCAWLGDSEALEALDARGGEGALRELVAARADLEVALERALSRGDTATAVPVLRALLALARFRGPVVSYREPLGRALALEALSDRSRVRLLLDRVRAEIAAGDLAVARATLDEAEPLLDGVDGESLGVDALVLRARLQLRSDIPSGVRTARAAVALAEGAGAGLRGRAGAALGTLLRAALEVSEAHDVLTGALELARAAGDVRTEARVLDQLGRHALDRGRPVRALSLLQGALKAARELGARPLEAALLDPIATLEAMHGRTEAARAAFERSLDLARELGDRGGEGRTSANLGAARIRWEELGAARLCLETALGIALELGDRRLEASARGNLGALFLALGRHRAAEPMLRRSTELARQLGLPRMEAIFSVRRAELAFAEGQPAQARAGMAVALAMLRDGDLRRDAFELLQAWAEREADAGDHVRAEELLVEASRESELSMADGTASLLAR